MAEEGNWNLNLEEDDLSSEVTEEENDEYFGDPMLQDVDPDTKREIIDLFHSIRASIMDDIDELILNEIEEFLCMEPDATAIMLQFPVTNDPVPTTEHPDDPMPEDAEPAMRLIDILFRHMKSKIMAEIDELLLKEIVEFIHAERAAYADLQPPININPLPTEQVERMNNDDVEGEIVVSDEPEYNVNFDGDFLELNDLEPPFGEK